MKKIMKWEESGRQKKMSGFNCTTVCMSLSVTRPVAQKSKNCFPKSKDGLAAAEKSLNHITKSTQVKKQSSKYSNPLELNPFPRLI